MSCVRCAESPLPDRGQCAYCSVLLAGRHEHDHVPVPARLGGKAIVPIRFTCHGLKDRARWADWDTPAFFDALSEAPPLARILVATLLGTVLDLEAENAALKEAA